MSSVTNSFVDIINYLKRLSGIYGMEIMQKPC